MAPATTTSGVRGVPEFQGTDTRTTCTGCFRSAMVEKEIRVKDHEEVRVGQKIGGNDTDIYKDSLTRSELVRLHFKVGRESITIQFGFELDIIRLHVEFWIWRRMMSSLKSNPVAPVSSQ